ncbi:endo-1,4-beta-xylanase [Algibacillus agarilyticus]|uniref:endo-1,4-beta-xylanase n=1 Tax=Algibacillus agarilyticus TaxID=2234133 RepID=UPI000DCFB150|nr:endo-1,4-beta-xylanase [Algibacillus agarilyticus]
MMQFKVSLLSLAIVMTMTTGCGERDKAVEPDFSAITAPSGNVPVDDTPVDDTPVDDTPVDDTPVDDTPVDDTPVDDTPVDDTPVDDTPVNVELLDNADFESADGSSWFGNNAGITITASTEQVKSGTYSGKVAGRTDTWNAPAHSLVGKLTDGYAYTISAWVRLDNASADEVKLSVKVTANGQDSYIGIANATATNSDWVYLEGLYIHTTPTPSDIFVYLEGPASGVDFYIDDVSVKAHAASGLTQMTPVTATNLSSLATMPIGVAVPAGSASNSLLNSDDRKTAVTTHFNQLSAENIMKMDAMQPSEGQFNFTESDALVSYAANAGLTMHGHVLVWHSQTPTWMQNYQGDTDAWVGMMESHVYNIAKHFEGKLASWDVVNEAFNEDGTYRKGASDSGHGEGQRVPSIWYENIGESFIEKAFLKAREADAAVDLYYNDYNISWNSAKLDGIITMAKDFQARQIPITGVGFQMHVDEVTPNTTLLASQFKKVVDLGLKVKITELDLSMNSRLNSATLTPFIAELQKQRYFDIVNTYLATVPPAQRGGITVWGIADSDSWIINLYNRADWPLLIDSQYQAKPALQGFADALIADKDRVFPDAPVDVPVEQPVVDPDELLVNTSFEAGNVEQWFGHGPTQASIETTEFYAGANSLKATNRDSNWNGIAHTLKGKLTSGQKYTMSVWVKLAAAGSENMSLSVKLVDDGNLDADNAVQDQYINVASSAVTDGAWVQLTGEYTHTLIGNETDAYLYIEGAAAGVEFYIDEASVKPVAGANVPDNTPTQLLTNPDFDAGNIDNWFGHGNTQGVLESTEVQTGTHALKATNRDANWNGIAHSLKGQLIKDSVYTLSVWVKLVAAGSENMSLSVKLVDAGNLDAAGAVVDQYINVASATVTEGGWVQLTGDYTHTLLGVETDAYVYVEGAAAGVEFYIDTASVTLK